MLELITTVNLLIALFTVVLGGVVGYMLEKIKKYAVLAEERLNTANERLAKAEALEAKYIKENL